MKCVACVQKAAVCAVLLFCGSAYAQAPGSGEWAGIFDTPLEPHASNTTRIVHTVARLGNMQTPDWKFVGASKMELLLPKYDRFQTLLSMLLRDYRKPTAQKLSPRPPEYAELRLECGGYTTGGQDAFAIKGEVFSVADGVGGNFVSPSNFSRCLADASVEGLHVDTLNEGNFEEAIRAALREAHLKGIVLQERLNKEVMDSVGLDKCSDDLSTSSTILVGSPSADRKHLVVGNIGDGGLSVYRRLAANRFKRMTALQTEPRVWRWNQPRQIATSLRGGSAEYADVYRFPIREGDLIVAASDGLIDNMYVGEVDSLLNRAVSPYESAIYSDYFETKHHQSKMYGGAGRKPDSGSWELPTWPDHKYHSIAESEQLQNAWRYSTPPGLLAKYLTLAARWQSANTEAPCPFNINLLWDSMKHFDEDFATYLGDGPGKPDDVTATACWVVSTKDKGHTLVTT